MFSLNNASVYQCWVLRAPPGQVCDPWRGLLRKSVRIAHGGSLNYLHRRVVMAGAHMVVLVGWKFKLLLSLLFVQGVEGHKTPVAFRHDVFVFRVEFSHFSSYHYVVMGAIKALVGSCLSKEVSLLTEVLEFVILCFRDAECEWRVGPISESCWLSYTQLNGFGTMVLIHTRAWHVIAFIYFVSEPLSSAHHVVVSQFLLLVHGLILGWSINSNK